MKRWIAIIGPLSLAALVAVAVALEPAFAAAPTAPPSQDPVAPSSAAPEKAAATNDSCDKGCWEGKRVLHIGDSHLANWGYKGTLRRKFVTAGADYSVSAWKGSNSRAWLVTGRLKETLRERRPDVVLINLGTNAVRHKHPEEYAKWIRRVVQRIEPRECYWIAPPLLIEDKHGFYDMLADSSQPCRMFDTRDIPFKRAQKKVFHLSRNQSARWAEELWKWINEQPPRNPGI